MKAGRGLEFAYPPKPHVGERWFVVHSRPKLEFFARENLELQGYRCFIPTVVKTTRHARQMRTRRTPFFPRYLFTIFDPEHDPWRPITGTRGVSSLVMSDGRPKPVPAGVVEAIIATTDETGQLCFDEEMKVGGEVRLLTGPFSGVIGTLVRLGARDRVAVLLDLLGGPREVETDRGSILPMGDGAAGKS